MATKNRNVNTRKKKTKKVHKVHDKSAPVWDDVIDLVASCLEMLNLARSGAKVMDACGTLALTNKDEIERTAGSVLDGIDKYEAVVKDIKARIPIESGALVSEMRHAEYLSYHSTLMSVHFSLMEEVLTPYVEAMAAVTEDGFLNKEESKVDG